MVRSLFSGVSGMKGHQTRLDAIGNNIANVNTYGFKSSRATFRDMYYQNLRGAAAGTANRGGLNPSSVGYGSAISSVDLLMTQSAMSPTGNPLDVAITGEGFLQVQDPDGNIFYTKAGMLDIDANGNLIDTNGYFVLGTAGDPLGKSPGSDKIQFSIPPVEPTVAEKVDEINGKTITISASNTTKDGNVSFNFVPATDLPIGQPAEAIIDGSSITIRLNSKELFASVSDLEKVVNDAITKANGGVEHPAGNFSIKIEPDPFTVDGNKVSLTGAELAGKDYSVKKGTATLDGGLTEMFGGFKLKKDALGDQFKGDGAVTYSIEYTAAAAADEEDSITITATTPDGDYTATLTKSQMAKSGSVILKRTGADSADTITLAYPTWESMINGSDRDADGNVQDPPVFTDVTGTVTPSEDSKEVGLSSKSIKLEGGTIGGAQTIKDLTSISIGADGTIIASHAVHGRLTVGRIDLANFDNPRGLQQSGNSYFAASENSGKAALATPGDNGTGALKNSALEMSNVDLSQEFADMITTQRGFQANSRIITVSDTMLEELINLKR